MPKNAVSTLPRPSLHPTHNDLPAKARLKLVDLLQARLCDAIDLMLQCKQAHWTIKGPHFAALHAMFDEAHDEARLYVDDIAERAAALGGHVVGTAARVAQKSTLPPYPTDTTDGLGHVAALAQALGAFAAQVRAAIDASESLGDAATADLFTAMTRQVDKRLWMIEAHTPR